MSGSARESILGTEKGEYTDQFGKQKFQWTQTIVRDVKWKRRRQGIKLDSDQPDDL